jgi:hypothetical protein
MSAGKLLFGERQDGGLFRLVSPPFDGELSKPGYLGEFSNLSRIEMSGHTGLFWSYQTIRAFANAVQSAELTLVTPTLCETGALQSITGVSFLLDWLVDLLQELSDSIDCDFLFLTRAGGVVIDSFKGAMPPKSLNSSDSRHYPLPSEIGDFGGNFAAYRSITINSDVETIVSETLSLSLSLSYRLVQ